jgi:deoxycytidylate deaminase
MDWQFLTRVVNDKFDKIKADAEAKQVCLRKATGCAILRFELDGTVKTISSINGPTDDHNICTNEVGNCGCGHAEPRAIIEYMKQDLLEYEDDIKIPVILLTTYSSCTPCANLILMAGFIHAVAYEIWAPHWARADQILRNAMPVWKRDEITPELLQGKFE